MKPSPKSAGFDVVSGQNHSTAAPLLICAAVREETRFFKAPDRPNTQVLITGIGFQKASRTITRHLQSHQPRLVITCGFAGGLNPNHALGRVLFDDSGAGPFRGKFNPPMGHPGRFVHSDRVLTTAAEKARLFESTGGDAVEMESSAIVAACRERETPVIIARVISDTATEDLPMDFNHFSRPDGSLSMPRLLLGLAKSPSVIPKLMTFRSRLNHASKHLATALSHYLTSDNLL